jgi:hypothetical protein
LPSPANSRRAAVTYRTAVEYGPSKIKAQLSIRLQLSFFNGASVPIHDRTLVALCTNTASTEVQPDEGGHFKQVIVYLPLHSSLIFTRSATPSFALLGVVHEWRIFVEGSNFSRSFDYF